jgi:hypothetical protein
VFRSGDVNSIARAIGSTVRVWMLFAFGVGAASGLAIGLDRLGANDALRFALPLCVLIAVFGVYVLGVRTVLDPLSRSALKIMDSLARWEPQVQIGFLLRNAAVFGLPAAVGFIVLFALLEMAEGIRAVGLAAFAAVGVVSGIKLIGDSVSAAAESMLMRSLRPTDELPDGMDNVYAIRVEAQSAIAEALVQQVDSGTGAIITCGVAGRDFLHFGGSQYEGASLLSVLNDKLHEPENAVEWDIMLLDPDSPEAERRADYEGTTETLAESRISIENYRANFAGLGDRIRCWLYLHRPFVFAVITEDVAFEQRLLSAPQSIPFRGRYGDLTPVFRYRVGSRYYRQLRAELVNFRDSDCRLV